VISQWMRIRSCAAVTAFVTAICVCGTEAAALTLPAGPTGPVPIGVSPTTTLPDAPTLPSTTEPTAPKLPAPKATVDEVITKTKSTTSTITNDTQDVIQEAGRATGGGSTDLTEGTSSVTRSVSRLASDASGSTGSRLASTAGGLTGDGGGAAGSGGAADGAGGDVGSPPGGGGGGGSSPSATAALLRAESGLGGEALAGIRGAGFEALQAAVASLAGCVGELGPLEQRVLVLRFGLGGGSPRTLGAVARTLGISRTGALRTERRALRSLRVASATTGCAAAGSGIAAIFDPKTIGAPAAALFGAGAAANGSGAGGPLGASVAGAAVPSWPGLPGGDIGWLLIALVSLGGLLTLAGVLMGGWVPPLPSPVAGSRALERIRRPGTVVARQARAPGRGPQPLAPRVRYRRPDKRNDS
jgi:hypothetical protein